MGLVLRGLGAQVVKVEPPGGSPTRQIGPFLDNHIGPESSLFFWHYNRGKQSVALDLDRDDDRERFRALVAGADVLIDTTPRGYLDTRELGLDGLRQANAALVTARISPFGDSGPWADWKASDLVHLALGGPMMNCGYDPFPDGTYDTPPIAPQMWHAYHIAGEQLAIMIVAALIHRQSTGLGQHLSCAVHQAVSTCTELDLMSWAMRAAPLARQTCRHAAETVSAVPTIMHTKDGRWVTARLGRKDAAKLIGFLDRYGMGAPLQAAYDRITPEAPAKENAAPGRDIPGSEPEAEFELRCREMLQRVFGKFTFSTAPWREAQLAGLLLAPLRRPEENMEDAHWLKRGVFGLIEHPELGRTFQDVVAKWVSTETSWQVGRRAPVLNEDEQEVFSEPPVIRSQPRTSQADSPAKDRSAVPIARRPRVRPELVLGLGGRDPLPGRAGRRMPQGGVERPSRLAYSCLGDGAGGRASGCARARRVLSRASRTPIWVGNFITRTQASAAYR